LKNSWKL